MSIEQSLERIAVALEILSGQRHPKNTALDLGPCGIPTPPDPLAKPATIQAAAESSAAVPALSEREMVKAELDKRGIKYNPKLSTKSLTDLLKSSVKEPELPGTGTPAAPTVVKPVPPAVSFLDEGPAEPVKVPTYDDVKGHLKRFAAKFGSDKAIAILEQFKCKDVSAVIAEGKSSQFVEEVLKQEKEHERK